VKPLIVLIRIIVIGCFWSVFFLEGIRVIMLRNWRFDIISSEHWQYAWDLWMNGWVISDAKEWAFVLIIVTFIPLWLTGWAALSLVAWENMIISAALLPVKLFRKIFEKQLIGIKKIKYAKTPVKKKQSYKEIRPRGTRPASEEHSSGEAFISAAPLQSSKFKHPKPIFQEPPAAAASSVFEHSLLAVENDDDDFVFNFDAFDVEPKETKEKDETRSEKASNKRNRERGERETTRDSRSKDKDSRKDKDTRDVGDNRREKDYDKDNKKTSRNKIPEKAADATLNKPGSANIIEIMKQKGYQVITGTTVKNTLVDFIGVAKDKICLCLLDREPGDWLADEERFNDEEPLWFSESSHRISPVRKLDIVRKHLQGVFSIDNFRPTLEAYVIVQLGNIINAEDMFDIWNDMDIKVTRIDRGSPKDIMLFAKGLSDGGSPASDKEFEKIKKLIRK
jgi:hypothetical protein